MLRAVGHLGMHGARGNRVGIASAVQQEILVLHVHEGLWVESHPDEMEVRVEAVYLDRVLDVVGGRAVTVVVRVVRIVAMLILEMGYAVSGRQRSRAEHVCTALCAQVGLL